MLILIITHHKDRKNLQFTLHNKFIHKFTTQHGRILCIYFLFSEIHAWWMSMTQQQCLLKRMSRNTNDSTFVGNLPLALAIVNLFTKSEMRSCFTYSKNARRSQNFTRGSHRTPPLWVIHHPLGRACQGQPMYNAYVCLPIPIQEMTMLQVNFETLGIRQFILIE